jgi:hypothetical protein
MEPIIRQRKLPAKASAAWTALPEYPCLAIGLGSPDEDRVAVAQQLAELSRLS